ncbi:alpha/beta hydrolase [Silicimonas algicola]|uniref:Alpha-beta hydrolase superfamily lysophospholipase n=1 Tax=Silicimonas algicola TaxID=1826607 RepID=A0A316G320_9RHOB|nr:alpha/beta hydrolase [Silicimonas algicola]AZQ65853.1 alpha/beta hydrolase [Silicimonas algicola]PWK54765.1 alpha-beta hydrolase superfamily lysophospholipase [Silicimonas algicola]
MLKLILRIAAALVVALALLLAGSRFAADRREVDEAAALTVEGSRMIGTPLGVIHVVERGPEDGVPVLLVHGAVGWSGMWVDTLDVLAAEGYRAIAIDLPPMGLSERSDRTDYSRQAQGLRILATVEAEGMTPILVAHSFGAGAVAEAMIADPDTFRGAVIVDGALSLGQDGTGRTLPWYLAWAGMRETALAASVLNPKLSAWLYKRFLYRKDALTEAQHDLFRHPLTRKGTTPAMAAWLPTLLIPPRGARSTDAAAYADLDLPVLLIWGTEDTVTPPREADLLSTALGGAPVTWLEGVGHIPQVEEPAAFHAALVAAIDGLSRP